jgi:hypothetical protein
MPNDQQPTRHFRLSHMVLEEGLTDPQIQISKYLGDKTPKAYRAQRPSVPYHLNCALWLSNILPATTEADLINEIRTGAVYAVHIRPPQDGYITAGANVVLMKYTGAEAFLQQSETNEGIRVLVQVLRSFTISMATSTISTLREAVFFKFGTSWGYDREFLGEVFQEMRKVPVEACSSNAHQYSRQSSDGVWVCQI